VADLKKFEIERESQSGKEFILAAQQNLVTTARDYCTMIRNALFNGNNQYWLNSSGKPPVFVLEGFPNNLNEMTIFEEEICPIDHLNRFGPLGSTVDETQQLESHLYNKSKFLAIERATHNELNDLC